VIEPTEVCVAAAEPPVKEWLRRQAVIHIRTKIPEFSLEKASEFYREEAGRLEKVLYGTLPGGTYSELLVKMLLRRACQFRVSFGALEVK